ncbi:hypothetical protein MHYP_G00256040 [Metynnis hypsauchen]
MTLISCSDFTSSRKGERSDHLDNSSKTMDASLQSWPTVSSLTATHHVTQATMSATIDPTVRTVIWPSDKPTALPAAEEQLL